MEPEGDQIMPHYPVNNDQVYLPDEFNQRDPAELYKSLRNAIEALSAMSHRIDKLERLNALLAVPQTLQSGIALKEYVGIPKVMTPAGMKEILQEILDGKRIERNCPKFQYGTYCCDEIKDASSVFQNELTDGGDTIKFCPFCGEKQ